MMNDIPTPPDDANGANASNADQAADAVHTAFATPDHEVAKAALKRIRLVLDTNPHWLDDKGFVISTNDELDDAQCFIRDNLDLKGMGICSDWGYEHLKPEHAQRILDDLGIIWAYPFLRDELSEIAMELSLCPMHFIDWAACFDDERDECAAIRAIFPYSHDT